MAGEHSGLVHQPPDLVGASHPGVVSQGERKRAKDLRGLRAAAGPGELGAGSGHARHLVFLLALGL